MWHGGMPTLSSSSLIDMLKYNTSTYLDFEMKQTHVSYVKHVESKAKGDMVSVAKEMGVIRDVYFIGPTW